MASGLASIALLSTLASVPTPLRLTADVEDAYAVDVNPAALAFLDGFELRLLYGRADADFYRSSTDGPSDGFGVFTAVPLGSNFTLGASVEVDVDRGDNTAAAYSVGMGWSVGRLALGMSYATNTVFDGDSKGMFDFGMSLRLARWLAMGLTVHDLAQHAQRRQWDIGLALRPWERLTLSTQWRITQSEPLNDETFDMRFLLTTEPIRGLTLGVGTDLDATLFFNLGLSFGGLGLGTAVNGVRGDPAVTAEVVYDAQPNSALIEPEAVVVVELEGALKPAATFSLLGGARVHAYGGIPLLLEELRNNPKVRGAFVRIGNIDAGWAKAAEVRRGLVALKESGRRLDCQLFGRGDLPYYIATACDGVIVSPPQMLEVNGVAANVLFFGDALDQLGVHVEVVRRGEYKTAPEQLTRSGMSTAHREALGAYIDTVYEELVDAIVEGRGIEREKVIELIDRGTVTSSEAVQLKLVDERLYPDEIEAHLRKQHGLFRFVPAQKMLKRRPSTWARRNGIAIIHIDASITGGESNDMPFGLGRSAGARTIIQALEVARVRSDVKAVVLRVDSPGGDATASDLIARAVRKLAEVKPVIASFGDIAASGGYYVAADARTIFAEPTTLTGSIGVFSMSFSFEQLMAGLGIHASVVERGELASSGSSYFTPDDRTRALIAKGVDDAYDMFLDVVTTGRKMERDKLIGLAEGRIWSGADAKKNGLVDELGGLSDAVRAAKLAAGFGENEPIRILTLPKNRVQLSELIQTVVDGSSPDRPDASDLLPADVVRAVGTMYAPFSSGRGRRTLALVPWLVTVR